jgi:hypothetical protein
MNRGAEPPPPLGEGWGEGYVRSSVYSLTRTLFPLGLWCEEEFACHGFSAIFYLTGECCRV